jgi:transposase
LNSDETSINVNGKRIWLYNVSNERWTYFYPHEKRVAQALNEIGILLHFKGTLVHNHWKPYYTYALCNAHHIRELESVIEHYPAYTGAKALQDLLHEIHKAVEST